MAARCLRACSCWQASRMFSPRCSHSKEGCATSGSTQQAGRRPPPVSFLRAQTSKEAADNVSAPARSHRHCSLTLGRFPEGSRESDADDTALENKCGAGEKKLRVYGTDCGFSSGGWEEAQSWFSFSLFWCFLICIGLPLHMQEFVIKF